MIDPSYWFMLPLGVVVATTAMATGISASNFWIPIYIFLLKLDPMVAFWLSLATMMFGYGSGTVRNIRAGTVNWSMIGNCMKFGAPAAIMGGFLSPSAPKALLLLLFGIFVLVYGAYTLYATARSIGESQNLEGTPWRICLIGAFLQGLISTGLGKLLLPRLLNNKQIDHHAKAVGSAVVITFFASLCALLARLSPPLLEALSGRGITLISILVWVAPGVITGGQLGPRVAKRLPRKVLKYAMGCLLILVGVLILYRALG